MRVWLKQLREKHNLTEQDMAGQLDLQVDLYESIENGTLSPNFPVSIMVAAKIAEIFDVPLSKQVIYENEYLRNK